MATKKTKNHGYTINEGMEVEAFDTLSHLRSRKKDAPIVNETYIKKMDIIKSRREIFKIDAGF